MRTQRSYNIDIWIGSIDNEENKPFTIEDLEIEMRLFFLDTPQCFTVTPTTYYHVDGKEEGYRIGLINYPRFPKSKYKLRDHALKLADQLMWNLGQKRVSVVTPKRTYMLEHPRLLKYT